MDKKVKNKKDYWSYESK